MPFKNLTWFKNSNFESLEIKDFEHASDKKPTRSLLVTDPNKIKQVFEMIEALPVEGEMMISFSDDIALRTLNFKKGDQNETIEFYGKSIKTPATSFYMGRGQYEEKVYAFVDSLLKTNR